MDRLISLLGVESGLDEVSRALRRHVERDRPPVVGAMQVTCADESERECIDAFQKEFVNRLLPELKFWSKAPFRSANLGGRYEWGSVRMAEQHFALPASRDAYKTLVVKINAHVSAIKTDDGLHFGRMKRYRTDSTACGALYALLDGMQQPFTHELAEAFASEGKDRLTMLRDPDRVDPSCRALYAAMVNARIQARHAILDIQDYRPITPTVYIIVACVTLNRPGPDTELLCGFYTADCRGDEAEVRYQGLGDDPTKYHLACRQPRLQTQDDQIRSPRTARDHRRLVAEQWRSRRKRDLEAGKEHARHHDDRRLREIAADVRAEKHRDHPYAKVLLGTLLGVLVEISPIPAAMALFAGGLGSIWHAHRMHRLAREADQDEDARRVLREVRDKIDELPPERVQGLIENLLREHGH